MLAVRLLLLACLLLTANPTHAGIDPRLQAHLSILKQHGRPPLEFVIDTLDEVDLIVFDDAWHPCAEPFEFYEEMVRSPEFYGKAKWVFVEVFPINKQGDVDAYLRSDPEDVTLLYPALQDDLSGTGWALESYLDLLHAIWEVNDGLLEGEGMRVVCVNAPTYWGEMEPGRDGDVAAFRRSLVGNDYTMYRVIADEMGDFAQGRKGVFLTNTRHAYKGIRDREGRLFWNAGTFLHERHPGKTASIRFHNMALSIEGERALDESTRHVML